MKQLLSTMILLTFAIFVQAQQKTYLTFDPSCMDRLEYRYSEQTSGRSILSYTVKPNSNDLYVLDIGAESIRVQAKAPKGVINCSRANFTEPKVTRYNNGLERLYVVRKTNAGYIVTPVGAITKISKNNTTYTFVGPGYRFALDENPNSTSIENIGQGGTLAFFRSKKEDYCLPVYTVTREPDEVCTVKTDYAFMPGVGYVGERTGLNELEKQQNALYLHKVNGISAKQHIESICPGAMRQAAPVPETYAHTDDVEDKEEAVIRQAPPAVQPVTYVQKDATGPPNPPYVQKDATAPAPPNTPEAPKCKELQGEGYHIVQPRESLGAIARVYGVKMQNVIAWNKIPDPNHIEICYKLWLMPPPPNVEITAAPAPGKKKAIDKDKVAKAAPAEVQRQWGQNPAAATPTTYAYTAPQGVAIQAAKVPTGKTPEVYGQKSAINAVERQAPAAVAPAVSPATHNSAVLPDGRTKVPEYINPTNGQTAKAAPQDVAAAKAAAPAPITSSYKVNDPNQEVFGTQIVHVVQPGETWYSIARKYGYTVDRFARLNGIEPSEVLKPGMKLLTSDCTCPNPSLYLEQKSAAAALPETKPVEHSNSGSVFKETAVAGKNGSRVTYATPESTTPKSGIAPTMHSNTSATAAMPSSGILKTHIVKSGETVYSIAETFRVSLPELLQWNNLESNDVLFPGKTLIVGR